MDFSWNQSEAPVIDVIANASGINKSIPHPCLPYLFTSLESSHVDGLILKWPFFLILTKLLTLTWYAFVVFCINRSQIEINHINRHLNETFYLIWFIAWISAQACTIQWKSTRKHQDFVVILIMLTCFQICSFMYSMVYLCF